MIGLLGWRILVFVVPFAGHETRAITVFHREQALTAIYAYHAYGDHEFLQIAMTIYDEASIYLVTTQDAAAGTTRPRLNVTLPSTCQGGMFIQNLQSS